MLTTDDRRACIDALERFPANLEAVLASANHEQLCRACPLSHPTLDGDWTVAQTVHHIADSHLHSVMRMKWILTEDRPRLLPWAQRQWARTAEATAPPVADAVLLLQALHRRWVALLRGLREEEWQRVGIHPELGDLSIDQLLETYARHGADHLVHMRRALEGAP